VDSPGALWLRFGAASAVTIPGAAPVDSSLLGSDGASDDVLCFAFRLVERAVRSRASFGESVESEERSFSDTSYGEGRDDDRGALLTTVELERRALAPFGG